LTCIKSNLAKVTKYHLLDLGQIKLSFVVFGDLRMKKSLLALAALSAFATAAQAQSSVTVYGLLDVSVESTDSNALATNVVTKTTNTGRDGGLAGSRIGFRGTEDLGGGLKANFVAEFQYSPTEANNGLASGTRLGFVELQDAKVGSLRAGRQVSPTKAVNDSYTTFGNSSWNVGSVTGGVEAADTTSVQHTGNAGDRVTNAITYLTPVMSGFQAQIQVAKDTSKVDGVETTRAATTMNGAQSAGNTAVVMVAETAFGSQNTIQTNQTNYGVSYNVGALSLMYGRADQDALAPTATLKKTNTEHDAFGVSYKLGAATLFATYNDKTVTADGVVQNERKDTTVGINYNMGKWDLKAAYAEGEVDQKVDISGAATGTGGKIGVRDIKGYQIAAVYNLSKRTNVYAGYGDSETKTKGTALTSTRDGYIAGVRHSF
jgi:predicted porin